MNIFSSEHIFKSLSWEESSVCRALANCRQNAAHSGYRIRHKELLPYPIKSFVYHLFPCWQTCKLSKDAHYLWSEAEKNTALASLSTFVFIIKTLHHQLKWSLDEMRDCKTYQKEKKNYEKQAEGD